MDKKVLSVSEINSQLKAVLQEHFRGVCVEGEICNFVKHPSGHHYFSLKDKDSIIKCVLFQNNASKLKITLENDLKVQVSGDVSIYGPRGEYQIVCSSVTQCGVSFSEYTKIKEKLQKEGLFDEKHKKPLPEFPHKIALITSRSGAALQDMLFVANKRWNLVQLTVFNTLVQGVNAKNEIIENIKLADNGKFDIIILARGGGSFEDLWAFNEEVVARAIFDAKTPIVSAIGHESDFLISDFVADKRAPTPSAAMEIILPDKDEWLLKLDELRNTLDSGYFARLDRFKSEVILLESKLRIFRFDYKTLSENLAEARLSFTRTMQGIFKIKGDFAMQKETLDSAFLRIFNKSVESPQKDSIDSAFLRIMEARRLDYQNAKESLNATMERFLTLTALKVTQSKAVLEASNPSNILKNGFVQVTKGDKIIPLQDLQYNDEITLSDGKIVKNAVIRSENEKYA